ncbi:MAG: type III pantothenate kinase [Crocinitomicaceae bacterium]
MNLIIDQGNTQFKIGLFEKKELKISRRFNYNQLVEFKKICLQEKINRVIISSVIDREIDLSFLNTRQILLLDHLTPLPIKNNYKTPQTLGRDRIANVVGAWVLNPQKSSLVIDSGTCIKYDIISENGQYIGGNIAPGLRMRFQALNYFTDQLPELEPEKNVHQIFGTDTNTSLQCGVFLGMEHEINGFINRYKKEFSQLTIFMTGGDLKYFDKRDKKSIFANQNLTLIGLNEILNHNAQL